MTSSLIPERPLLISPTLAATIGLEETVMLHVISELLLQHPAIYRNQRRWAELNQAALLAAMPFWDINNIQRIQRSLHEKGLIQVEAVSTSNDSFLFTINQKHNGTQPQPSHTVPTSKTVEPSTDRIFNKPSSNGAANLIPANWQPSEDLYQQCQQHNIKREFIAQRVRGFVMYWSERGKTQYSWHHTFLKWIIKEWRQEQSFQGAKELEAEMSAQWRPNGDALSILEHAGISTSFIEDAIPEFVLYWRERGLTTSTWNTKFIAHIRRQWGKFNLALEHDNTPRLIPDDYEPSSACYEVLAMANIDLDFAHEQVKEFILYWQERKDPYPSWNTKFLQHVKYKWANQGQASSVPIIEKITDRSWAE